MLRLAQPVEDPEEAVTVAVAAVRLGIDESTVRALVRKGDLEGFKVGKGKRPGGVRIEAESIRAYKRRNAIAAGPANDAGPRPIHKARDIDTERWLRSRGIIP